MHCEPRSPALQAQGLTESLVVALSDSGALAVTGALCQLVERREFRRVTPALMSMYFQASGGQGLGRGLTVCSLRHPTLLVSPLQAFRGQDAASIVSAHKEATARAAADAAAAAARKAAGSKRGRTAAAPTHAPAPAARAAAAPAAVVLHRVSSKSDPLAKASEGYQAARAAEAASRNRRWAGAYIVPVRDAMRACPVFARSIVPPSTPTRRVSDRPGSCRRP